MNPKTPSSISRTGQKSVAPASLSRRGFIGFALAGSAGTGLITPESFAADANKAPLTVGRRIVSSDTNPVVETHYGKIRGSIRNGIYSFKGVPYGADTNGANRWLAAKAPTPWAGVKSTTCYSHTCPTAPRAVWNIDERRFIYDWSDGVPGEDVLNLSVWTPGINDNRKRPVLAWIHGGGYSSGSNEELKSYDGERLARRGDIVVVGLNHRLNILGFLNLEKYGEQYQDSQNLSQLDLVFGLQWIKNNIANFGGDPDAVTIFGQSGGGGKVTYLLGMPAAKGLFRAAAIESSNLPRAYTQEQSAAYSDRILAKLGIKPGADLGKLQQMPYAELLRAVPAYALAAMSLRHGSGGAAAFRPSTGPVIPELPFNPHAPAVSAHVPILLGAMLNEGFNGIGVPALESWTREETIAAVNRDIPGKGEGLYAAFADLKLPGRGVPFDLYSQMGGIVSCRGDLVEICSVRAAAAGQAPAYNYQFRWQSPTFDGRPRAYHAAGLQFSFDNVERCANGTGGGPDAQALADVMSEAWIAFIKTGNPNHKGMPKWDPVTPGRVNTMIFDTKVEQATNFDKEQIAMLRE